ncbi:ASKHA domain-containing protein [Methanospirillum sp.]
MNSSISILFQPMNRMVTVPAGTTVLSAIREAGIQFEAICGGKGTCGKCRVIKISGKTSEEGSCCAKFLTLDEQRKGYCLACLVQVWSDAVFTIPIESRIDTPQILLDIAQTIQTISPSVHKYLVEKNLNYSLVTLGPSIRFAGYDGKRPVMNENQRDLIINSAHPLTATLYKKTEESLLIALEEQDTTERLFGIALDLGTTTVVGLLVDLLTGEIIKKASTLNRQITLGEELVTRIAIGRKEEGRKELQIAALGSVNEIIHKLTHGSGIKWNEIYDICLGGNTIMTWLLAGKDPTPLEYVDAQVESNPVLLNAETIGIDALPLTPIFCLPAVSRFVGGDAIGDILTSSMYKKTEISLLIDLGTNGEIILGNKDWMVSTSCASGPAFEGAGMRSGMRAMKGAIDTVKIDKSGQVIWHVIGDTDPKGVCGSGIIDAAAAMAHAGILDISGKLIESAPGVREGEHGLEFLLVPSHLTATGKDIVITSEDMAYLMDSKAAVLAAIIVLIKKYRLTPLDIHHVYLAGAFSSFGNIENLISFGILPEFPSAEFHRIGNGSLAGAYACLISSSLRKEATDIAKRMGYLDLLVDNDFIEEYWGALRIPEKDELFLIP